MQRSGLARAAKLGLAAIWVFGLGGCGGKIGNFDAPENEDSKPVNFLGLGGPPTGTDARRLICPDILVLDGAGVSRVHSGSPPTNANLQRQYSIDDVSRECSIEGEDIAIKVGVAGKVLLGPAGSPGGFTIPVRVAIIVDSDNQPLVSKLYRVAATIPAGQTNADFTVVTEPLRVPFLHEHAERDYSIKAGIDEGAK
jgi:hypothetical protein